MRVLLYLAALLLVASHQAQARGGGGGGGGGFHGGAMHGAFRSGHGFRHPGFARHQQVARFADRRFLPNRQFANNLQNGFPVWWGGWGWGFGWPDNGYPYGYQPVQQAQNAPSQPQVIVIRSDGDGRMTTAEATPDYGYVQGCHAIPSGYHCDTATQTR